jgi:hypothetical protein
LKVLKALARHNNTDFDADYKLPKILKNYKGNDIFRLSIEVYSSAGRPLPPPDTSRNSFKYFRASDVQSSTSATKLFGEVPSSEKDTSSSSSAMKSASRSSIPFAGASSSSATKSSSISSSPSPFPINEEWNKKWKPVIPAGCNVIHTSMIGKRNQFGMNKMRQLVLTDQPSLIYVEVGSMSVKGDVAWDRSNPPKAAVVSFLNFFFSCRLNLSLFLLIL